MFLVNPKRLGKKCFSSFERALKDIDSIFKNEIFEVHSYIWINVSTELLQESIKLSRKSLNVKKLQFLVRFENTIIKLEK